MSDVRLVVREAERDWSGTIPESCADQAIAALSADPVTLEELEDAVARFVKPSRKRRFFGNLSRGLRDEPYDAGLVIIDMVARLIVTNSPDLSVSTCGVVAYHDGRRFTSTGLRYHLANDWLTSTESEGWRHRALERRRERAAALISDARAVLYGRPLLEFIASGVLASFGRRQEIAAAVHAQRAKRAATRAPGEATVEPEETNSARPADDEITREAWPGQARDNSPFYDTLKEIHVAWMMTPRADLGGACPREVLLERHEHIDYDLEDRCDQWSRLGECAPGLKPSSHAFRYGGFGTHELVKYYELVRELLWSCWEHLTKQVRSPETALRFESLALGDFLATEVPRLEQARDAWLDGPDPEWTGRTPRSIIDRERARLPELDLGEDAMMDLDDPCCELLGELSGPAFWHLDGSVMDGDFAFDLLHRTREEWEGEQRLWDDHALQFEANQSERERHGSAESAPPAEGDPPVWSHTYIAPDAADHPPSARLLGISFRLMELIERVRAGADHASTPPQAQRHIDELNRVFGNLRAVVQSTDSSLAEAMIDPVLDRFAETLAALASGRPDLVQQCESLTDEVRKLFSPGVVEPIEDDDD